MDWTHNGCTYQIADRDGLAIFYLVAADHPTMRGDTYDRTAQEVEETLRLGLFKLLDVLTAPSALSPYIGFFEAINGNRQVIGLKLSEPSTVEPTGQKRHILGSIIFTGAQVLDADMNIVDGAIVVSESGFDYLGGFAVFPVPLPAALPLFLAALAGLGFFGWRRRRAAD